MILWRESRRCWGMETISVKVVKSRKEHTCDMCGRNIQKGDEYEVQTNKNDGMLYIWKNCHKCLPTVRKMHKEGWYPDGITGEDYKDYVWEHGEVLGDETR
jgi:uncharacterized repeat protein (TIGR04076 family)